MVKYLSALAALSLAGCNLVLGLDPATETLPEGGGGQGTGGTGGAGGEVLQLPPPFECVGSVEPISEETEYAYRLIQSNGTPIESATISLCAQADDDCSTPLQEDIPLEAEGYIHITLEPGFTGYLKVVPPDNYRGVIIQLTPLVDIHSSDRHVTLYTNLELGLFFSIVGSMVKEESGTGILAVYAADCAGNPPAHLTLVGDTGVIPETEPVYFDTDASGNPAIKTGLSETTAYGVAGFLNYSTNNQDIHLELTTEGNATVSRAQVLIREYIITYIFLPPNE